MHYARIAQRELSDRDKQKIFSYTYKVKILGTFYNSGNFIEFTTAVRKLPTVSYHARHLTPEEIKFLLNKTNDNGVPIGYLCIGTAEARDKGYILFDINKLRNKRTMIFAQSGFGKTNLMKVMLYNMLTDNSYGKLIFDLNGEYYLKSEKTYGLGDINEIKIKDNLVVYSDKPVEEKYKSRFIYKGKVLIKLMHLYVSDIIILAQVFRRNEVFLILF